jgi:uncharacterized membrane protein YphA (DoxX/SURF4 family)
MARRLIYWIPTGLVAAFGLLSGVSYLLGTEQVVTGFARLGYPQQLRLLLGIAKPLGAAALLIPGWPRLKEWVYAGFTFAWIAAIVAHYRAEGPAAAMFPLVLLVLLAISYVTRPAGR